MSRYVYDKDLLKNIDDFAKAKGTKIVRDTCKFFLTRQTEIGTLATPRKPIPHRWVEKAYNRQRFICKRCGLQLDPLQMVGDHRVPIIKGGRHTQNNIDAMHRGCNASKGGNDQFTEAKLTGRTILEQELQLQPDVDPTEED
jgi:hypothetical protein